MGDYDPNRTREKDFYREAERILDYIEENGPATRREIELEVHLSSAATLRRLDYLLDEGDITRMRDGSRDSRKYLYTIPSVNRS